MDKKTILIIGLVGLIITILAIAIPTIHQKGWGNNEMNYSDTTGYGLERICDEQLWQPPTNCRYTENAQKTLELLYGLKP